ncbi:MAG: 1-deoxy-D-xylulose-5-phosphate reductoisomerase [Deltaproteobacteria bacterium]|nr:1-deoxy-D-xylulose-5-phosphate reductoisomerase [Deltaproteobacteria bacterium]
MKTITILGSTGSIGTNALKVIQAHPESYRVSGLAAGRNIELLMSQIRLFEPTAVALRDGEQAEALERRLGNSWKTHVYSGVEGFIRVATLEETDTVISAMSGSAGLRPTYAAILAGKEIALANKETLVMAGHLIMEEARKRGVPIIPVDSEHSAILQCLRGHPREDLERVILTASGGPFRDLPFEELKFVTPAQALIHPNWHMGRKITIDSATLMNKGLEAIEAKWLFNLSMDQIHILIHPQSIVHSLVEYKDGSLIAQLGVPDMLTPISYALSYPHHRETFVPSLKLNEVGPLTFMLPEKKKFRCLDLALEAARVGESMPTVLNAANEESVDLFLRGLIGFLDIPVLIEKTMEAHRTFGVEKIEKVLEADSWAREAVRQYRQANKKRGE